MSQQRIACILLGASCLAGCATDLRTDEITVGEPAGPLQAGFVYNLPAAEVTPSGSIRVAGCPVDEDARKAVSGTSGQPVKLVPVTGAVFAVAGDIKVEQVAGKQVLIDYRELGDFLKTTSVGLERHPNLMLKSVNVSVEDQSPALIADLATVAANVALFTVSPAASAGASSLIALLNKGAQPQGIQQDQMDAVTYLACKPETLKLLEGRNAAREAKDKYTQTLEETNAALTLILRHADTGFTQAEIASIHGYRDTILRLTASIAEASETISKADAKLGMKLTVIDGQRTADDIEANGLPVNNIIDRKVALSANADRIKAFVDRHFVTATAEVPAGVGTAFRERECTKAPAPTCTGVQAVTPVVQKLATAKLTARPIALRTDGGTPSFAHPPKHQGGRSGRLHPSQGIIYVEPARYVFSLMQDTFPRDEVAPITVLKTVTASVPQKGTYLSLPVHAGFGEKVELKATFNTDGSLATGSYGRPSAAGKALSGSLASLSDKALATRDAMEARKLSMLKAEADRLTAQKAVLDAADKLNPKADPLADLNAQIAVANANATLAEANVRLMVANSKLNGGQ